MRNPDVTITPKFRSFGAIAAFKDKALELAHERFALWCQSKADNVTAFRAFLYRNGIDVNWHTASRWFHGETLPGMARLIEFLAAGFPEVPRIIFEPALLIGNREQRRRRIQEKKQKLEQEERDLEEMD